MSFSSIFFVSLAACLIHANLTIARTPVDSCLFCDLSYSSSEFQFDAAPPPNPTEFDTKGFMDNMIFDVTKYGGAPDGVTESASPFMEAWKHACDHQGNATFYIPEGTFLLGPISFKGPCYKNKSPRIELNGTLKALPTLKNFPSSYWIVFKDLYDLTVIGTSHKAMMDGQGPEDAWKQPSCWKAATCAKLVTSLGLVNITGGRVSGMSLYNSKGFHLGIHGSGDIHVHNMTIMAPGDSPNTDGIHISYSSNININTSTIGVGDDCVSIGPGTNNLSISNVQCGPGHGISVGSLGKYVKEKDVVGIDVSGCVLRGTQNGLRVKTWSGTGSPSSAKDIKFRDITMINVSNPILIDQHYCPSSKCNNITGQGSKVKISKVEFINVNGTTTTAEAVRIYCSPTVPCTEITLDNINLHYIGPPNRANNFTSTCQNAEYIAYSGVQSPRPCPHTSILAPAPSYNYKPHTYS